jgi:hypothetical protein
MRTAYLDIETSYVGAFADGRLFKDFGNHRITVVGIRVMEASADSFLLLVHAYRPAGREQGATGSRPGMQFSSRTTYHGIRGCARRRRAAAVAAACWRTRSDMSVG